MVQIFVEAHFRGVRLRKIRRSAALAVLLALGFASTAWAYTSTYGGGTVQPGNYIQSDPGHTYSYNFGVTQTNGIYMACQLFNSSTYNKVTHDYSSCVVYGNGSYVTGRVYNQSGAAVIIDGIAQTP